MYDNKMTLGGLDQLRFVLFKEMGLQPHVINEQKKTKDWPRGEPKMDEKALSLVDHQFIPTFIKYRKLEKVLGTYLLGIKREVTERGYLHPFFNLHTTLTYRSASELINFQNFPVRDPELSEFVRSVIIPRSPHNHIVEVDFSGIEVAVAYCYHKDPKMFEYLTKPGTDMHRDMAMQIYKVSDPKLITKGIRNRGKASFVFAQFYGDYYLHCAKNLWAGLDNPDTGMLTNGKMLRQHLMEEGIFELGACDPLKEPVMGTFEHWIKEVEQDFWNKRFKVYGQWKKSWYQEYQKTGGFNTLTGFYIGGVMSRNESINYPVQGSAFHCDLWTLCRLQEWIDANSMETKIIGQIHDSIVADVPNDELNDYLTAVKRIATQELQAAWPWIIVPMKIEAEVSPMGQSWFRKKQWVDEGEEGWWVPVKKS